MNDVQPILTVADNGGFFPRTVTGAYFNYTATGLAVNLFPAYYAHLTVNS